MWSLAAAKFFFRKSTATLGLSELYCIKKTNLQSDLQGHKSPKEKGIRGERELSTFLRTKKELYLNREKITPRF